MIFRKVLIWSLLCLLRCCQVNTLRLFDAPQRDYSDGEEVSLKVNKVFSGSPMYLPFSYYGLPVCKPDIIDYDYENIGQVLSGDLFQNSLYQIKMNQNLTCHIIDCNINLNRDQAEFLRKLVKRDYRVDWHLDSLPVKTSSNGTIRGSPGFPLGKFDPTTDRVFLNNYVLMTAFYQTTSTDERKRIVGFNVQASSIRDIWNDCNRSDVNLDELNVEKDVSVVYGYSLVWKEDTSLTWDQRWTPYTFKSGKNLSYFMSFISGITLVLTSSIIGVILVRILKPELKDWEQTELEVFGGWKILDRDVFRVPLKDFILAPLIGSGIQFFSAIVVLVGIEFLNLIKVSYFGNWSGFLILLYALLSSVGGYSSTRIYKMFSYHRVHRNQGANWKKNALRMTSYVPLVFLLFVFVINGLITVSYGTITSPFSRIWLLLTIWALVCLPLTFIGSYFGNQIKIIEMPRVSYIPRTSPEQPWIMRPFFSVLLAGMIPFGMIWLRLHVILKNVWGDHFYYSFGSLIWEFCVLLIVDAEIAIIFTYAQLCKENYHWWWRAFFNSGASSIYIFLYISYFFFSRTPQIDVIATLFFTSYTLLGCGIYFLISGSAGILASYVFVRKIYSKKND